MTMSDRIAVFNQGRIEQLGSASEIYHRPTTAFVAQFIGQANLIEADVVGVDDLRATIHVGGGIQLTASCPASTSTKRVLISIRPEKLRVSHRRFNGADVFPAAVEDVLFKGALEQLLLPPGRVWN